MHKETDQGNHGQHDGREVVDDDAHFDLQGTDSGHLTEINPGKIPCNPECRIISLHNDRPEDIGR